jgi:hypothetical protein
VTKKREKYRSESRTERGVGGFIQRTEGEKEHRQQRKKKEKVECIT